MRITARVITTRNFPTSRMYMVALEDVLSKTAKKVKKDFELGVKTWDHRPGFAIRTTSGGDQLSRLIEPTSPNLDQYRAVHSGVPGRMIYPRTKKVLRYRQFFHPKTRPGSMYSSPGGYTGPYIYSRGHWWPGITARDFSKTIAEYEGPLFRAEVRLALSRVRSTAPRY